ncbi:Transcription factor 25 [Saguinus oedipus]|uniref:Transcription factor 25 n=1 Tax=Saguinus oedipus TaxID=9490 RepID=A0ABQ9U222_SAGOE|nr:Transcription factor 25 [Saguinus oedipus]
MALEYCKLILSLEPDEDPLCMLLLIDHLALRARNYEYLICLFQDQQTDLPEHEQSSAREKASLLIQQVLTMFPGVLLPLLGYCSVRPDATVSTHRFFGPNAEISQPSALSQLRAPGNIHRHVILSEIKEAVAALPPDVTTQSVMGFDPLPPADTIYSYVRPKRLSPISRGNMIALFRSLLPNYTVEIP